MEACFYPAEHVQDAQRAAESAYCLLSSRIFTPQASVEVFTPAFIAWELS